MILLRALRPRALMDTALLGVRVCESFLRRLTQAVPIADGPRDRARARTLAYRCAFLL